MANTVPSTPFGKFFDKIGIWEPTAERTVRKAYDKLHEDVQVAVQLSSGYVAVISANVDKTPDVVFQILQEKFPDVTKDKVKDFIVGITEKLKLASEIPDNFDEAIILIQDYLKQYDGNTWGVIVRGIVTVGSTVLNPNITLLQKIEFVLEYIYQTFVKPKM